MKSVYKYPFEIADDFEIEMPAGADVLCVDAQYEVPCIWAMVDLAAPMSNRKFHLAGTGHPLGDEIEGHHYVGSFFLKGGSLVFHLFAL